MATQTTTIADATELHPISRAQSVQSLPAPSSEAPSSDAPPPDAAEALSMSVSLRLKLISTYLCFLLAGLNDGSLGALIPYMRSHYDLGSDLVAIIYIPTFMGWLAAAVINVHVHAYLGTGGVLVTGGILLAISALIRALTPVYGAFAFAFFLGALGMALQDAQANTFVASMRIQHRWLGYLHAMYGLGCLISPLAATAIATETGRWYCFYYLIVAMGVASAVLAVVAFRDSAFKRVAAYKNSEGESAARKPTADLVSALKLPVVWIVSAFYFCYLGAVLTVGGWVVEFLIHTRDSDVKVAGYMPIALYGGTFMGRVVMADVMHRFGERRMAFGCICMMVVFQLVFWLVPNLPANGVALVLIGFFGGPIFATGMSVSTRLIPKSLHVAGVGYIFVIGQVGAAVFPFVTGVVANKLGPQVLQPIATALLVACGVVWLLIPMKDVKHEAEA